MNTVLTHAIAAFLRAHGTAGVLRILSDVRDAALLADHGATACAVQVAIDDIRSRPMRGADPVVVS